jgi:hypothetical protein
MLLPSVILSLASAIITPWMQAMGGDAMRSGHKIDIEALPVVVV